MTSKMKKSAVVFSAAALLGGAFAVTTPKVSAEQTATKTVTVYRDYNHQNGDHLYTSSAYEWRQVGVNTAGWTEDGVIFNEPTTGSNVYRMYNPNSGEHFLTTSANERNVLKSKGWNYEGISFHTGGKVPVYRLYNKNATNAGGHVYTASAYEKNTLVKAGWSYEGVAWYALAQGTTTTQPSASSGEYTNGYGNQGWNWNV